MTDSDLPVLFFAFANDAPGGLGYLRTLAEEARQIRAALDPAEYRHLCHVEIRYNVTADEVFGVFNRFRGRVVLFHFAGHADSFRLLLQDASGAPQAAGAAGLAQFLGQQPGLQLVFLNGCSTRGHVDLLFRHNIPAVVATSQAIRDDVATNFANRFYQAFASGAAIPAAFDQAAGAALATVPNDNVRALYFGGNPCPEAVLADGLPWKLEVRDGADAVADWTLPDAAGDPLFGLPPLPQQYALGRLDSPFQYLNPFGRDQARVFFGRGYEIRELYRKVTDPDEAPVILFYGESGVGKSSLLNAGLLPRLEGNYQVRSLRRQPRGLRETLRLALLPELADTGAVGLPEAQAWRLREERSGQPALVILDQVEEAFTRPGGGRLHEMEDLLAAVGAIFADGEGRPRGKLILGFRKEWVAEVEGVFAARHLARTIVFLKRLERRGVIEAVRLNAAVRAHFHLDLEPELVEVVATELLSDPGSAVAPALQVLLSTMYQEARKQNRDNPRLTLALYRRLKERGLLLGDFLNQQLTAIEAAVPGAVASGLVLDILAQHTTDMGTAGQCLAEELRQLYAHTRTVAERAVAACKDHYLLVRGEVEGTPEADATRLAHDTLADLVRSRCEQSDWPGQRARRILDNRKEEWEGGKTGAPLDEADLKLVEQGQNGTRAWDKDETRLVAASQKQRDARRQLRWIALGTGLVALLLIIGFGAVAGWQWWRAENARAETEITLAKELFRPLGRQPGGLLPPEISALMALASLPPSQEPVRARFINWAFADSNNSRRFASRVSYALQAAVGLKPERAVLAAGILQERLKTPTEHRQTRTAAALALAELDLADGELSEIAVGVLVGAMEEDRPLVPLTALSRSILYASRHLPDERAATHINAAAKFLVEALLRESDRSKQKVLVHGLTEVYKAYPSNRAVPSVITAAEHLVDLLAKTRSEIDRWDVAPLLVEVCTALPTDATAKVLADALAKEPDSFAQRDLAKGLAEVCKALPTERARTYLDPAAKLLAAGLITESNGNLRQNRISALVAVCRLLPADHAATLLADALAREPNPFARRELAKGLAEVCRALPTDRARTYLETAAQLLSEELGKLPDNHQRLYFRVSLAEGLAEICKVLPKDRAQAYLDPAAKLLFADAQSAEPEASSYANFAEGLAEICKVLPKDRAQAYLDRAAKLLSDALNTETKPPFISLWRATLAKSLAVVCRGLPPERAVAYLDPAAKRLADTLSKEADLDSPAASLAEVCKGLPPNRADTYLGPVLPLLAAALIKTADSSISARLAWSLAQVGNGLSSAQAAVHLYPITKLLNDALDKETSPSKPDNNQSSLARGLAEGCLHLPTNWAGPLLLQRFAQFPQYRELFVSSLLEMAGRTSLEDAVGILKHPLCDGEIRRVFLRRVEQLTGQQFKTRWEMADWLTKNHPEINLSTPSGGPE
jgi:hypothetical protein